MSQLRIIKVVERTYQFLLINICFFITTFPLLFALVVLRPSLTTLPLYLLFSITLGPSLFSVMNCVKEITVNKDCPVISCYFRYFSTTFKQGLLVSSLFEIVLIIGVIDLRFLSEYIYFKWLNPVIFLLLFLSLLTYSNVMFFSSKQYCGIFVSLKQANYHTFKNFFISCVNGLLLLLLFLSMVFKPVFGFLIFPSIVLSIQTWNWSSKEVNGK